VVCAPSLEGVVPVRLIGFRCVDSSPSEPSLELLVTMTLADRRYGPLLEGLAVSGTLPWPRGRRRLDDSWAKGLRLVDKSDSESLSLRTTAALEDFRSPVTIEVDGLAGCGLWEWDVDGTAAVKELDWNDGKASSM